jgi:four helix bundle protein
MYSRFMVPVIRSFEDLDCWKAGREVRLFVFRTILPLLPHDEKFRLADQIRRSSRSITPNIAEGHGRFHYLDNAKFCRVARGSTCETLDHLITAHDERFIDGTVLATGRKKIDSALRLINGYIAYLKRAAVNQHAKQRTPTSNNSAPSAARYQ